MRPHARLLVLLTFRLPPVVLAARSSEEVGVRAVVGRYFHGHATLVLLKVDGAWKIANKVYVSRPTKGVGRIP